MRGSRKRAPRPRLIDRLLRLFHRTRFTGRHTMTIPAGVELRMSRRYLEAHRRIFGGIPPAGTTSRTILLHPMTLDWSAAALDGLLAHELTHVAQFDRWGFFGTYVRYFWGLWKHGYGDHPLEHEARSGAWQSPEERRTGSRTYEARITRPDGTGFALEDVSAAKAFSQVQSAILRAGDGAMAEIREIHPVMPGGPPEEDHVADLVVEDGRVVLL